MKRRKNDNLQSSDWWFHAEAGTLGAHMDAEGALPGVKPFASIEAENNNSLRLQKILFSRPASLPREWFYEAVPGVELRAYNHATRTGVYRCDDGQSVTIQCAENWFSRDVSPVDAARSFEQAQRNFRAEFGFDFLSSPTLTGCYAFESKLPFALPEGEPSAAWRDMFHNNTTQSRNEIWLPKTADSFYYYDRRFAYAADAVLELPCGEPIELYGIESTYQKFETAFYAVNFNVPEDWRHIGLLPVLGADGWTWPRDRVRGGHIAFVAEPELRLALAFGWPVEIKRKWLFQSARPLEKPVKILTGMFERAKAKGQDVEAGIYRKTVLNAIGAMYARSFQRESVVDESDLIERNDAAALTAESLGDGRYSVEDRTTRRDGRFYAPEWTAYIWSRARARLNSAMMGLPFDSILGCHVDAIYTDREALTIQDGGRVGQFRLKGKIENMELTLNTMADISRVKDFAEASRMILGKDGERYAQAMALEKKGEGE